MFDVNDYLRYSDGEDAYYDAQYNKYHSDDEKDSLGFEGFDEEDPQKEIDEIKGRVEAAECNPQSLSVDYRALGEIIAVSEGKLALDSAFKTFMLAMKSPKNDASSLAEAYKVLGTNSVSWTFVNDEHYGRDYKDEAIDTIIETSNSHKDGANSLEKYAQKAVGRVVKADGVAPETIVNRFKKSSEDFYGNHLDRVYGAFGDIARYKPELLDSRFEIFMKALKSPKNTEYSLSAASKALDYILKAKPELDNPLVNPIKVILRPMKYLDESQKMMNFGQTIAKAVNNGGLVISKDRIENEHTLSDCCKAWRICPKMPQSLAKLIGKHSIRGRVLAGAIFDKISSDKQANPQEWRQNKELQKQLYNDLENAEKMPMEKAFKQYVTDTPINRNRVVECLMREEKIKITDESFKAYYNKVEKGGTFDKMFAQTEDERQKQNRGLSSEKVTTTQKMSGIEK